MLTTPDDGTSRNNMFFSENVYYLILKLVEPYGVGEDNRLKTFHKVFFIAFSS